MGAAGGERLAPDGILTDRPRQHGLEAHWSRLWSGDVRGQPNRALPLHGLQINSCWGVCFDPFRTLGWRAAARRVAVRCRLLDGRTRDIGVGAEDAAVALQWLQHRSAMPAVIEILARVGWHRFGRDAAALRAS